MKQVAAVLLVAVAITYYMGYEPWELVPALESFVPTSTPPPKVRRAAKPPPAADQAAAPQPQRNSGSIVIAGAADDGSLEHRWESYPNSSPTKP